MSRWRSGALAFAMFSLLCVLSERLVFAWPSQQFRTSTSTVALYVTVTEKSGRPARNLTAADFEVQDNGRKQVLTVFKNDIQPITIAILLDASPSLFPVQARATEAVMAFARGLIPGDRACVGSFNQAVILDPQLTDRGDVLIQRLQDTPPAWPAGTAIWDAIDAGSAALASEGGRRVILLVTDGADNASRANPDDIRTNLQRGGVLVYAIGVRGRFGLEMTELEALANSTGGRAMELKSADDIPAAMGRVAEELHSQYVLGFTPQDLDDKWHRIRVKVRHEGLAVRAPRMYFAARSEAP